MPQDLTIFSLASALAQHASQRQDVIAQNVAHADTPGFKARDLTPFSASLDGNAPTALTQTRPGHVGSFSRSTFAVEEISLPGAEAPNGNTVSLEDQMLRSAQARQSHDLALGVYSKALEIMRLSLGRRG
ncbi:MAG: FlgB family protein [Pseudomonadota bacterium]